MLYPKKAPNQTYVHDAREIDPESHCDRLNESTTFKNSLVIGLQGQLTCKLKSPIIKIMSADGTTTDKIKFIKKILIITREPIYQGTKYQQWQINYH